MSTGARLPKSTEPSVDGRVADSDAVDQHQVSPGLAPRRWTCVTAPTPPASSTSRPATPRRTSAMPLVPSFCDFGGGDDGHRGAGLADRLFDAIGGDDDFRQLVGVSGGERRRAGKSGEDAGGPRGGPRSGFEHGSSGRPTDGGLGCTVKGRSPGSRLVAPLLLPRTLGPQWMTWRAACRLQLRGQPRHWPA